MPRRTAGRTLKKETAVKKILIAGANSYIGDSFKRYMESWPDRYEVSIYDTMGAQPSAELFKGTDAILCVAGIAHIKETDENRHLYFDVNRDLVVKIAEAAKEAGVRQMVLLSSMSVYGMDTGFITKETTPRPVNAYGESKLQADELIRKLEDESFLFACLRPPMVYGKNCKGNYQRLREFALKSPVFPNYNNKRSMVYIGNLCEFVKRAIDEEKSGLFFPQNAEYTNTSRMVELIAQEHGKKIRLTKAFNWALKIVKVSVVKKVFGDLTYEKVDLVDRYGFEESVKEAEH